MGSLTPWSDVVSTYHPLISSSSRGHEPTNAESRLGATLDVVVQRITDPVEAMHHAIVAPWLRVATGRAAPTAHRMITATYSTVRAAGSLLAATVDAARVVPTTRVDAIRAFANAVWDEERTRSGMSLRDRSGAPASSLDPTGRVVVLVHGLGQTERAWVGLVAALEAGGMTPLMVRYDSGRPVSENADDLSRLLAEAAGSWSGPIEEIALVGYSMGGLVARKALDVGRASGDRWADSVRRVVFIAAPHLGSPIEKAARLAAAALSIAPQSRPLGEFIESRSPGIRDLGSVLDAPPAFEGVSQHVIAGVATSDRSHPLGVLVGDLVVRVPSASGEGAGRVVAADDLVVVGKLAHARMLDDPQVRAHVLRWLQT